MSATRNTSESSTKAIMELLKKRYSRLETQIEEEKKRDRPRREKLAEWTFRKLEIAGVLATIRTGQV